jgi:hypothetical protein
MTVSDLQHLEWSDNQSAVIQASFQNKLFYRGPAGTGKTTAAVARLAHLIESGIPAESILVLVPQRTLAEPFYELLRNPQLSAGGVPNIATVGGIARRMTDLYWPLVAENAGFADPNNRPVFLTLETAQYYMARVVTPIIEEFGYFESITIDRNRLYSQIIDNLNKAAVVGFPISEIAGRLAGAWVGDQAHTRVYEHAQECAVAFRQYCLDHNLLDFSLQIHVFFNHLWTEPLCRNYIEQTYSHLIYDNIEEDTPVAHDMVISMLSGLESALFVYDEQAGYRQFLGADAEGALVLADICDVQVTADKSFIVSPSLIKLGGALAQVLGREISELPGDQTDYGDKQIQEPAILDALKFEYHRYHPQMLDWVADEIASLVKEREVNPGDIVVIAPFLSDALRFSLMHRLTQLDIPVRSHRPSRALRDEPAARTLLTLAALAHPQWKMPPARYDVVFALVHAIDALDLVRAQLLTNILYRVRKGEGVLLPFDNINPDMQQRITYVLGDRYERLRTWLAEVQTDTPQALDHFLSRLFGEVLSVSEYGFHNDITAGRVSALLIESVRKFRWISADLPDDILLGAEYMRLVKDGVIAAQYLTTWRQQEEEAVLLSPAYTFLLRNRPVRTQFWLNVGGKGWWERLYQPLTHPTVLSRRWSPGKPWTDADEFASRQESLYRVVLGLIRRCRDTIYLGLSELGEEGYEQDGALLKAIQRVLRRNW